MTSVIPAYRVNSELILTKAIKHVYIYCCCTIKHVQFQQKEIGANIYIFNRVPI